MYQINVHRSSELYSNLSDTGAEWIDEGLRELGYKSAIYSKTDFGGCWFVDEQDFIMISLRYRFERNV